MIYVDDQSVKPLYKQIYEQIKQEILSDALPAGSRLPAIRVLAEELCVSKNTVENAYQQLLAEGYVSAKRGSGYAVEAVNESRMDYNNIAEECHTYIANIRETAPAGKYTYDFQYGDIAAGTFPYKLWNKYTSESICSSSAEEVVTYRNYRGDPELRNEIRAYLKKARAVNCRCEQIIVTCGTQHTIECLCRLLNPETCRVGFEEPGYDGVRMIFEQNRIPVIPLTRDTEENYLKELDNHDLNILYLTPSHQFPLGNVMSISTRYRILKWASEHECYLIEDDYDSEYRHHTKPLPSLKSMDVCDRVIYIGTFSKALAPGLRLNYMVLPERLLSEYDALFSKRYQMSDFFSQKALAAFMRDGHWERHLRKMCRTYGHIHDALVEELNRQFGDSATIIGDHAGLHILVEIHNGMDQEMLIHTAQKKDVRVYGITQYYMNPSAAPKSVILMGYGNLDVAQVRKGIQLLAEAWLEI